MSANDPAAELPDNSTIDEPLRSTQRETIVFTVDSAYFSTKPSAVEKTERSTVRPAVCATFEVADFAA